MTERKRKGTGPDRSRSLLGTMLILILLLILLLLIRCSVTEAEGGPDPAPEAEAVRTILVPVCTVCAERPETVPKPGIPEMPEEDPIHPEEPEQEPLPAITRAPEVSGTGSGERASGQSGLLGTLTYKRKSVGIWPDIREETLLKGPGWMPESALPGEGMAVIFGHRNRNHLLLIKKIREGDTLTFTYPDGRVLTYRVRSVQIFEQTPDWMLPTESGDMLVIATCYPFEYTGSAPGKFQVIADRIG